MPGSFLAHATLVCLAVSAAPSALSAATLSTTATAAIAATPAPEPAKPKSFTRDGDQGARVVCQGRTMTFEWRQDADLTLRLELPLATEWRAMQALYRGLPHDHGPFEARYVRRDPFAGLVHTCADRLRQLAHQHARHPVDVALRFVQSLPYAEDMGNYQRYASETLIDAIGDCSDTSVLFAAILNRLGVRWCFVNPPQHLAVLLADGRGHQHHGAFTTIGGVPYYFAETTGYGWYVGQIPSSYVARAEDWVVARVSRRPSFLLAGGRS